ncbi:phage head morphogenesis protein [Gluconobacter sphaericus]|uniref:Head morphogenesis protein n=1 Tax=Gluconobacter sphaericus NBRC 12467 TaxID=1307951 RepID=A0AA37WA84_9PROT|nr:phage minor head protein [Gluconobacter sphaericus]GBR56481.1 putative phage head morphogenesis protein [Gluconobacter sphaericus NBRC 12467]GEB42767.1 head morphogenesis protein [Gluconobacter sphaericus NBRC 12467]GLQ84743.1 head morphogenesis protein [Gluconobacter sphaericus NBRC 12467]GLQ85102.1 head morphogenesis protein [Gluconobacter sphaericus NBRC 12467]
MTQLRCTSATGKALKPTRASAALEALYYRDLMRLIREMDDSLTYWLTANYRKHETAIAQDSVADELQKVMNKLTVRWRSLFDDRARKIAERQAGRWKGHADTSLMDKLRQAGFAVKFRPSKAVKDVLDGAINENVSLIKSIADHHLTEVSQMVQRSVMAGRDLGTLTADLKERYGIAQRRAAFIARDQNNKATSFITRTRQIELGLTEAIWCHSSAGKHPRPNHVKAGRERLRYDIRQGADVDGDGKLIFPGEEPNCRCTSQVIIPGFDD